MKRLTKELSQQRTNLLLDIEGARDALDIEVSAFNSALTEAWGRVQSALDLLNEKITEADEWRMSISQDLQEYFDERSERWQEGDAGSAYQAWISDWEQDLVETEIERPDDLEMPDIDALDVLENLPDSPG